MVQYRFCSFGSNWNNKKSPDSRIERIKLNQDYLSIDVTQAINSNFDGDTIWTKGIIVKPSEHGESFTAISTGDSSLFPAVFEVNYV